MFDMVVATTVLSCRRTWLLHVARGQQQHAIAVHHPPGGIGEQRAIGIAVEGDAEHRTCRRLGATAGPRARDAARRSRR